MSKKSPWKEGANQGQGGRYGMTLQRTDLACVGVAVLATVG